MRDDIAIHWFRNDLRLSDNPALFDATKHKSVLPIFILDTTNAGEYAPGRASMWWLNYSLISLKESLLGNLSIYKGNPIEIITDLTSRLPINSIYWNRSYEPWLTKRDKEIKKILKSLNLVVKSSNGSLLWEPWEINKEDGTPYKVFTPFFRKGCLQTRSPRQPLSKPEKINYTYDIKKSLQIDQLNLLPKAKWESELGQHYVIGEKGAYKRLERFISQGLDQYKEGRNFPSKPYVSRLSPHLRFGEISPNQVWHTLVNMGDDKNINHFCSELGWREFSYNLLYHNPDLPKKNLQSKFDNFPWQENRMALKAWQKGQTGVPMVDAGMRELWQTGYMHNRVRMIVGSFLVKNLRLHWHHGERWFWDTLVDADLANNSASWQWIAGCGADAAPYFRIFNPITQGEKFDPNGDYIRSYVPEISNLPNKYLFCPWEAPASVLDSSGIKLGQTYPEPIISIRVSREKALEAFKSLKENNK